MEKHHCLNGETFILTEKGLLGLYMCVYWRESEREFRKLFESTTLSGAPFSTSPFVGFSCNLPLIGRHLFSHYPPLHSPIPSPQPCGSFDCLLLKKRRNKIKIHESRSSTVRYTWALTFFQKKNGVKSLFIFQFKKWGNFFMDWEMTIF